MRYFLLLSLLIVISCQPAEKEYSGEEILKKSIQKHDPKGQWNEAEFSLRIQEPRLQNPIRFSEVSINNGTNAFELKRNRDEKVATYAINADGVTRVLLDNKVVQDSILIDQYMLQHPRVKSYQRFYQIMLGLPMSLDSETIETIDSISAVEFNEKSSYRVEITLKKPIFSRHWNLFISTEDFTLLGVEMVFPDNPNKGERLYFDKSIQLEEIQIPRIRHWYKLDETYSGSDVIVKKLN